MNTEQYLWQELCKMRDKRNEYEKLPRNAERRGTIIQLADCAVTQAAQEWLRHITRQLQPQAVKHLKD